MRLSLSIVIFTMIVSLLGNVVANYVTNFFEEKRWFAVVLFLFLTVILFALEEIQKLGKNSNERSLAIYSTLFSNIDYYLQMRLSNNIPKFVSHKLATWLIEQSTIRKIGAIIVFVSVSTIIVYILAEPAKNAVAQNVYECPPYTACILVASFKPDDSPLAQQINEYLRGEVNKVVDVVQDQTGRSITIIPTSAISSTAAAKQIANARRATLIVWGEVSENQGTTDVHFQLSDRLGITESNDIRPFRLQPILYDSLQAHLNCTENRCSGSQNEIEEYATVIAHIAVGLFQYGNGEPEQARKNFLQALYCTGRLRDKSPLFGSEVACETPISSGELNLELLYYLTGRALEAQGDYANAIIFLEEAKKRNEEDPAALISLVATWNAWLINPNSTMYQSSKRYAEQKVDQLRSSISNMNDVDQIALESDAGIFAEMEEDWQSAIQHYQAALELSNRKGFNAYVMLVNLARVYRLNGERDNALETLNLAIESDQNQTDPKAVWAKIEVAKNQDQGQGMITIEDVVSSASDYSYAYLTKAELCEFWNDWECAAHAYEEALQLRDKSGWLQSRVAEFYQYHAPKTRENLTKASELLGDAVQLRPCDPWSHARFAYSLTQLQTPDLKAAIAHYSLALALIHPDETDKTQKVNLEVNIQKLQNMLAISVGTIELSPLCKSIVLAP